MATISSEKNVDALTLTFVSHFDAPVNRVWQVWEDARQLESWWGPPSYPATFETHSFSEGGESRYYMTSPEGEKMWGWWRLTRIDAPHRLEYDDGFANSDGSHDETIAPTHTVVTLDADEGGTTMTSITQFSSAEQLDQMVQLGMEEGMTLALGQIDEVLEANA